MQNAIIILIISETRVEALEVAIRAKGSQNKDEF